MSIYFGGSANFWIGEDNKILDKALTKTEVVGVRGAHDGQRRITTIHVGTNYVDRSIRLGLLTAAHTTVHVNGQCTDVIIKWSLQKWYILATTVCTDHAGVKKYE